MIRPWQRKNLAGSEPIDDRRDEAQAAINESLVELTTANELLQVAKAQRPFIEQIAAALLHEGAANHFTERFEIAYRKGHR